MPRHVLDESKIHPAIRQKVSDNHRDIVEEVLAAMQKTDVVVSGMAQNPNCGRACKALTKKGVPFTYVEKGGYLSEWRKRNALKMWTGWPTFPMVFVKGMLVGGADDLDKLIASGELDTLLQR
jgi:glutaredoxin-related protein